MEFSPIWRRIQRSLFPRIEDCLGPLTEEHRKIVAILEIVRIEDQIRQSRRGTGRPPHDWLPIARAFVAKAILNLSSTRALIERLQADATLRRILGFRTGRPLPHESAFSRVFGVLARTEIPERTHAALDTSAIPAREKARNTRKSVAVKIKRKRGRPKRGETVPPPEVSGVARILPMTPARMKRTLPRGLFVGRQDEQSGKIRGLEGLQAPCLGRGGRASRLLSSDLG